MSTDALLDRLVTAIGHHYDVESELGRGGMSVVYRARDLRLNRPVAVKVLPPELAHDPSVRSRFTREAQTSAQLAHPHIVPIHDVGEQAGIAFFVMPFVTGGHLAALLEQQPRRPVDEVRRILSEIADALSYAHLRGVVHRDIKADNILLDADTGRVMVTDFGIARALETGSRLTVTGMAVGTPTYMSPEQALGERELDGRSDLYSLGVLGYQMVTGRVPFSADNSMALLLKHVNERPRPISELRPETPRGLCDVIERALAKAPEDRWPTAAAMRDALSAPETGSPAWRAESKGPVRYASPVPRSRRREPADMSGESARAAEDSNQPVHPPSPPLPAPFALVPPHLASLTNEQRADLRLWNGRVNLLERVKHVRRYLLATLAMSVAGGIAFVAGVAEFPPLVVAPIVPIYMMVMLRKRSRSLRESGFSLPRVYLALRARRALPTPELPDSEKQLARFAPRELLAGPRGAAIRRAADDRAAILEIVQALPKADRALLPDIEPTVDALLERIVQLASALEALDADFDPSRAAGLDASIAGLERNVESADAERRLSLLRRHRATVDELVRRRAALGHQIDNAGLALGNLRLDLVRLRSSGVGTALGDVSTATQEVRALSRDIALTIDAAAEVRKL